MPRDRSRKCTSFGKLKMETSRFAKLEIKMKMETISFGKSKIKDNRFVNVKVKDTRFGKLEKTSHRNLRINNEGLDTGYSKSWRLALIDAFGDWVRDWMDQGWD